MTQMLALVGYFLKLGTLGFGGPVALANYIRRDLVEERAWLTEQQYEDGLALSAACPGPLAYQLGVYCGYVLRGIPGALAVAAAFALPPFVIVLAVSLELFLFFFKTGFLVFGSGLVIVPFLKTEVVDHYRWLGNAEFLDAVAIGMISPGPVVITATFVGYLLNGFTGATTATLGIFLPPVLFVVLATPLLLRYRASAPLRGFIRGVSTAVVGVLAGTTWLIARTAIVDVTGIVIAVAALVIVTTTKRVPDPLAIAAAGVAGLLSAA